MQTPQTSATLGLDLSLLAEIFEQAPAFIAILTGPEHVFEMANRAYHQVVGHRDIIGKPVRTAVPEVEEQGYIGLLDSVLQTGTPYVGTESELLLQATPDGPFVQRYVNFVYQARRNPAGEIVGVFVHGVDVTDLVQARRTNEARAELVRKQAQTFDALLTNLTDFLYTFDRNGRFLYANKPLLDLLGLTENEVVGKTFFELPYPEELARTLHAHILHVVDTKEQIVDETLYISPKGKSGYYEYIFTPIVDADGAVTVVAGSTRDITELKLLERQKTDFLAIASHELKTPLTSLKAYGQVLQRQLTKDGQMRPVKHLVKMDTQINRLITLINDLLDVTMIESGAFLYQDVDFAVDALVAETIEEVQRTTARQTILHEGMTDTTIHGDRIRIGQVLINMLTNAIKYAPDAERIVVRVTADADMVTLRVQDFGMGISPDKQTHVFERFYRATEASYESVPGLGLGLYVCAEIIQRHGGTMWVESELGQGSTFCFTLPIRPPQPDLI